MIFARRRRSSLSNTHGRNPWIRLSIVNRTQNLQGKRSMALWRMQQRVQFSGGKETEMSHKCFPRCEEPCKPHWETLFILDQNCMALQEESAWERLSMPQTTLCFSWNIWLCVLKIISKTWWVKSLNFCEFDSKILSYKFEYTIQMYP